MKDIFKEESVFLIGGGPSLKGFDFSILKDKNVIAINKALLFYPNADILYWTDTRFFKWYEKEINEFKGLKITNKKKPIRDDVILLKDTGRAGLEINPTGLRHGNNSGYAAINVAFHTGAKNIILLGYDMKAIKRNTHFHDGYNIKHNPKIYKNNMLPHFKTLIKPLKDNNVFFWNTNLESNLKDFPFCTLEEALNLC